MAKEQASIAKYNTMRLFRGAATTIGQVNYKIDGSGGHPAKITATGRRAFIDPTSGFDENTISTIGSITKQFTAATLMKLWDNEITEGKTKWFPKGLDTPLAHFMPQLKKHFANQGCDKLFASIEADIAKNPITLRKDAAFLIFQNPYSVQ